MGPAAGGAYEAPAACWRYLGLAAVPIALTPLLLTSQWGQSGMTAAIGYASALVCAWRWRTGRGVPAAWAWIAVGLFLNASGSLVEAFELDVLHVRSPSPGAPDALYLALYPCMTVGLLLIVRSRCPELGYTKLIDAAALLIGLGLLCWVFLIHPTIASASGSPVAQAVQIAYPVGDLALLAILARVMAADGWRAPSVLLLCLGLLGFLLGDTCWAIVNAGGWKTSNLDNTLLGEPFLVAFALVGAAALHRSAGQLDQVTAPEEGASRVLVGSLVLSALAPPALLAEQALSGHVTDGLAIAICSALRTGLVVARTSLLVRRVQRQAAELHELALEDPLTGLPNRRALQSYLAEALGRARRDGHPLSLAMIDLDHFKLFNDEYGHAAGDHLLKAAASAWLSELRETDMLARIGGEEFVLALPGASSNQAVAILTKLQSAMPLGQTLSAGVAQWDSEALPEELFGQADRAMYEAKRAGRDRIVQAIVPATGT